MTDESRGAEVESESRAVFGAGAIRYRVWPARRHPWRLLLALACVVGASVGVALLWRNGWWAAIAGLGLAGATVAWFFPTEVALDGARLVVRQLGTPREYDLRAFRRVEVVVDVVARAELGATTPNSPLDSVQAVAVPLPHDLRAQDRIVAHMRRWVGRRATGQFTFDDDHAPDDDVAS